ncbi:MAG: GAF domain-containing protein [Pseudomonadota bacterium]
MNWLATWVAMHFRLALVAALSWALLAGLVTDQAVRLIKESERLSQLQTETDRRAIEVMSQTLNGNIMGALSLLGLIDQNIKREARGELPPNEPGVTRLLDIISQAYDTDGTFVVGEDGIIKSSTIRQGKRSTGLDVNFRPYFQMALQGTANVYAAIGLVGGERSLYFAAPLFTGESRSGTSVGAVVSRITLTKLEYALGDTPNLALLLSPQGVVFASNRGEWVGRLSGQPTAERLKTIRDLKQFGNLFENKEPLLLPMAVEPGVTLLDDRRHVVAASRVQWNDPYGDWTLVLMEDLDRTLPLIERAWIGAGLGVAVLLASILLLFILRGRHVQGVANRQLQAFAAEQEARVLREARLAEVSMQLQQADGTARLGEVFLTEARVLLGALQGAIYVVAPATAGPMQLVASQGCAAPLPQTLASGEGLLGQCAVERRMRIIESPGDNYWNIHSGLGEARPHSLVVMPILLNDRLLGVIELALLGAFTPETQALLDAMMPLMAMNITTLGRHRSLDTPT